VGSSSDAAVGDLAFSRTGGLRRPWDGVAAHGLASGSPVAEADEHGTPFDGGPRAAPKTRGQERASEKDRGRSGQQGRKRACLRRCAARQAGVAGWRPDRSMRSGRS